MAFYILVMEASFKILNRTVTCRSIVLACGMEIMVGLRLDADGVNDVPRKKETIHT